MLKKGGASSIVSPQSHSMAYKEEGAWERFDTELMGEEGNGNALKKSTELGS